MGIKIFSDDPGESTCRGIISFSPDKFSPVTKIINYFTPKKARRDGNPNKYKYKIVRSEQIAAALVVEINYPDCYNHKGNKILLYDDAEKFRQLHKKKCIDPHFLEKSYSPSARFEPSERGWKMAIILANLFKI